MRHKLWIFPLSVSLLLFAGCGDEKQKTQSDETKKPSAIVVTEGAVKKSEESPKNKENSGQFYYSYNKEKKGNEYNSEATKTRTELDAYRDIRSPYERVQITLMVQQLSPDDRPL